MLGRAEAYEHPGKAQLSCFPEEVWQNRKYIRVLRVWVSVSWPTQCTYINSPWEAETSYNIQVTTIYIFYLIRSNSYEPVLTCLKNSKMFSAVYKNNEIDFVEGLNLFTSLSQFLLNTVSSDHRHPQGCGNKPRRSPVYIIEGTFANRRLRIKSRLYRWRCKIALMNIDRSLRKWG